MIVWLNGAFGAGKSSTASHLRSLLPGSRIFDPETVGYMLRPNLADLPVDDFQHWQAWRPLVVATALELVRQTRQRLIAPQTVMHRAYLAEIIDGLHSHGLSTFHVLLDADDADDAALRQRIEGSDEAREWRLDHLDEYREARPWMAAAADLVVDTGSLSPNDVARKVADALPNPLMPENGR